MKYSSKKIIEIKRHDNGNVIHSGEFYSIKGCLLSGLSEGKSFEYADLRYADLSNANLSHTYMCDTDLTDAKLTGTILADED